MSKIDLRQGDCLELMKDIPDGSVDAIITDPPYGYSFTGKGGGGRDNQEKTRFEQGATQ